MINLRPMKTNPALPRLSTGIASFFVPRIIVSQSIKHSQTQSIMIESDWQKVGNDLRQAMRLYDVAYLKSNR